MGQSPINPSNPIWTWQGIMGGHGTSGTNSSNAPVGTTVTTVDVFKRNTHNAKGEPLELTALQKEAWKQL